MQTAYQPQGQPITADDALARRKLDSALLQLIATGGRNAMRVMFQRHSLRIYRFALLLVGDAALAENIVSDVFIEVWRGARGFKEGHEVTTWLLALTRQKARAALQRRSDARPEAHAATVLDDPHTGVVAHQGDRDQLVRACLARLSPPLREIVDLVYYHGRTIDEVAYIVGASISTIKSYMIEARSEMAKLRATAGVETS
jgi:RNA polymerase sigma-70 factor, ECF subfamily